MPNVIVVPETEDFEHDVSHRNVQYLAPFWTGGRGVNRVYHIVDVRDAGDSTEIELGNSFVLRCRWTKIGQNRRFEYHPLADFGLSEIKPGLLDQ